VKELAANDHMKMNMSPSSEEEPMEVEDNGSLEESDLARLQPLNEGEISADLFTFNKTVSELQLLKEELLCSHTRVAEMGPQWTELDHVLLAMTNDVGCDQRAWCSFGLCV
jgi:hypothetical protein